MKFLPEKTQNQSGQILVIFLLVLVVGLAVTLSIASRTVTDIRQTTTSDESNRSYFAAESGVEKALKAIESGSFSIGNQTPLDLTGTNRSSADINIASLSATEGQIFEFTDTFWQDEVGQVSLMYDFNDITTGGSTVAPRFSFTSSKTLNIYWDEDLTSVNPQPAIEVSIVTCSLTPTLCSGSSSFEIRKMLFDPLNRITNSCNSIITNPRGAITSQGTNVDFKYKVSIKLDSNAGCPFNDTLNPSEAPVMARIRFLYNTSKVKLGVESPTGNGIDLPTQGQKITSLGKTPSGVSRKLVVNRMFPALPAIFDYVLFNGSTSCLTKTNPPTC